MKTGVWQLSGTSKDPKIKIWPPLITAAITLLAISATAQAPNSKKIAPHRRAVSLGAILDCANDPLIVSVFKTDRWTASDQLNAVVMIELKNGSSDSAYLDLRLKGFVTRPLDESSVEIMPTEGLSGKIIAASTLPFCQHLPTARYKKSDWHSGPVTVEIGGADWILNPNEIWAHADQFHFGSGVFTNSSDVFLTASKGRVSIQFICRPDGLKFYRAFYSASDET